MSNIKVSGSNPAPRIPASGATPKAAPSLAAPAHKVPSLTPDSFSSSGTKGYNAFQRHGAFFDLDNDHKVTLKEMVQGLMDMGVSRQSALRLAPIINGGLALPEGHLMSVDLDAIQAEVDPNTPGAFDAKGHFDVAKFDRMFAYDHGGKGSLTEAEIGELVDHSSLSSFGKIRVKAGYAELFKLAADTTKVVKDDKGRDQSVPALSRSVLQAFFTGTVFYQVAERHGHPHPMRDGTTYGQ